MSNTFLRTSTLDNDEARILPHNTASTFKDSLAFNTLQGQLKLLFKFLILQLKFIHILYIYFSDVSTYGKEIILKSNQTVTEKQYFNDSIALAPKDS